MGSLGIFRVLVQSSLLLDGVHFHLFRRQSIGWTAIGAKTRHPHEEVGKTEQVVLRPDVGGMAMTLGTLQTQAEEGVCRPDRRIDVGQGAPLPEEVEGPAGG